MARTSLTHPIQVAELAAGGGVIGLTFCPGKQSSSLYGQPWARDLGIDLAALKAWGATALVTLMERHEFAMLKVPDLGEQVAAAGMEWIHLPIVDVSVPGSDFPELWAGLGASLRARLARHEKIVLHCRGGLGRTGLVAALLLIDLGDHAETAIAKVRKVRPGAIETRQQEEFVRNHAA